MIKRHTEDKVLFSKTGGNIAFSEKRTRTFLQPELLSLLTAVTLTSLLYRDAATPIVHTAKTEELFYFFSSRLHFCSEFFFPRSQGRLRAKAIFVISFPHVQYQPSRTRWTDTLFTGRALRKLRNRSGAGGKRKKGGRIERSYFLPLLIRSIHDSKDRQTRPTGRHDKWCHILSISCLWDWFDWHVSHNTVVSTSICPPPFFSACIAWRFCGC